MRFPISFNIPSKVALGILGMGPSRSWADVKPDAIHARMGWGGDVTIPRQDIATVEKIDQTPWWLGFGVHGMFGTWALNGALTGAVRIRMKKPAKGRVMFFPVRPHTIYFSLESPDEFVFEVRQPQS